MTEAVQHHLLIVEGDRENRERIAEILEGQSLAHRFADTGEAALDTIKNADTPFSLILSAQSLAGMNGTSLLEQARKVTPDTVRFLMAKYSEMETIIHAVNESAVNRFFVKPFETEDLIHAVHAGLKQYASFLEHEQLLVLAKEQNAKLYDLGCDLMEATTAHNSAVQRLEGEIEQLKNDILALQANRETPADDPLSKALKGESEYGPVDARMLLALFTHSVQALFSEFSEAAERHGFEMKEVSGDSS